MSEHTVQSDDITSGRTQASARRRRRRGMRTAQMKVDCEHLDATLIDRPLHHWSAEKTRRETLFVCRKQGAPNHGRAKHQAQFAPGCQDCPENRWGKS